MNIELNGMCNGPRRSGGHTRRALISDPVEVA